MRVFLQCLLLILLNALTWPVLAAEITAVRSWRAPDNTRLVLDLDGPVTFRLSPDSTPARLVIDLDNTQLAGPIALPQVTAPLRALHFEKSAQGQRLIIDTQAELSTKLFQLPPNEKYSQRLVVDLFIKATAQPAVATPIPEPTPVIATTPVTPATTLAPHAGSEAATVPVVTKAPDLITSIPVVRPAAPTPAATATPPEEKPEAGHYRNIVIAIDAGHGGEDPGATGAKGTHEKHVTLAIARELEALLKAEPGLSPVLTRTGDYFIPLQDRRRIARYQHKADIFISIHADAAENRSAKGSSVFALSLKGAGTATSRFARMLAERENRSDLIGGAAIESGDDTLRNVLADMVVAGSLDHSLHMGRQILEQLSDFTPLHSKNVEQAGFAVLKEPGMVSLLVETGFISNPQEEENLTSKPHQRQLAKAIFDGVLRYNQRYPAPGSYFAWQADHRSKTTMASTTRSEKKPDAVTDSRRASITLSGQSPATTPAVAALSSPLSTPVTATSSTDSKVIRYRIAPGDNLTRIADRHQVSLNDLRALNNLQDDTVKIGQTLKIPAN